MIGWWHQAAHEPWIVQRPVARAIGRARPYVFGTLLDVGCGRRPFATLLADRATRHIGMDQSAAHGALPDVLGDAQSLPFVAGSFDTVLCTHVLVHVPEPARALNEMARVLAPGGHLILTARQMWHVYTERDYFRYTASGLQYLARQAGLEVLSVEGVGGIWARIGVKLLYGLQRWNPRRLRWLTEAPVGLLGIAAQAVCAGLDRLCMTRDDVVFNVLVARKP